MSSWQVFGLPGYLLAPASQFIAEPVLWSERSFLLPLRGSSGFSPDSLLSPISSIGRHEVKTLYQGLRTQSNPTYWARCANPVLHRGQGRL